MGYLKGKSSLMIFERFVNLKYKFDNKVFWTKGYYVSTVGLDTKKVQEYIRGQEKEDLMTDSMSTKEYVDPFKEWQVLNTIVRPSMTIYGSVEY